jgi:hypothetical protein
LSDAACNKKPGLAIARRHQRSQAAIARPPGSAAARMPISSRHLDSASQKLNNTGAIANGSTEFLVERSNALLR